MPRRDSNTHSLTKGQRARRRQLPGGTPSTRAQQQHPELFRSKGKVRGGRQR